MKNEYFNKIEVQLIKHCMKCDIVYVEKILTSKLSKIVAGVQATKISFIYIHSFIHYEDDDIISSETILLAAISCKLTDSDDVFYRLHYTNLFCAKICFNLTSDDNQRVCILKNMMVERISYIPIVEFQALSSIRISRRYPIKTSINSIMNQNIIERRL